MKDKGYVVPPSQARRALASERLAREECISGESAGALVSWTIQFNEIGNGNFGEVLYLNPPNNISLSQTPLKFS